MASTSAPDLEQITTTVLGDLAFMVADDAPLAPAPERWLRGEVAYRGPISGSIVCYCTPTFAGMLASNLLATSPEEDETGEDARDAFAEFLNILCGNFVTTRYGRGPVFSLSIPKVESQIGLPTESEGPDACRFAIEGQRLLVQHTTAVN